MERYTKKEDGKYVLINCENAAERLYKLENLLEYITSRDIELTIELDKLKLLNKEKNYKFKELMGQKLMNTSFIQLLDKFEIL